VFEFKFDAPDICKKAHKLVNNLGVLLEGERTIVGAVALVLCITRVIKQDKILDADKICNLIKEMVEDKEEEVSDD
jgi:hypothetical protein